MSWIISATEDNVEFMGRIIGKNPIEIFNIEIPFNASKKEILAEAKKESRIVLKEMKGDDGSN